MPATLLPFSLFLALGTAGAACVLAKRVEAIVPFAFIATYILTVGAILFVNTDVDQINAAEAGQHLSGELFAVGVSFAQLIEMHRCLNGVLAAQIDEMWHEGHVLPVTNLFADIAIGKFVLDQPYR